MGDGVAYGVEIALGLDEGYFVPELFRHLLDGTEAEGSGNIYQYIYLPVTINGSLDEFGGDIEIGNISEKGYRLAAGFPDGLRGGLGIPADSRRLLFKPVLLVFIERCQLGIGQNGVTGRLRPAVIGHHPGTFMRQADGDSPPDSLAGP